MKQVVQNQNDRDVLRRSQEEPVLGVLVFAHRFPASFTPMFRSSRKFMAYATDSAVAAGASRAFATRVEKVWPLWNTALAVSSKCCLDVRDLWRASIWRICHIPLRIALERLHHFGSIQYFIRFSPPVMGQLTFVASKLCLPKPFACQRQRLHARAVACVLSSAPLACV